MHAPHYAGDVVPRAEVIPPSSSTAGDDTANDVPDGAPTALVPGVGLPWHPLAHVHHQDIVDQGSTSQELAVIGGSSTLGIPSAVDTDDAVALYLEGQATPECVSASEDNDNAQDHTEDAHDDTVNAPNVIQEAQLFVSGWWGNIHELRNMLSRCNL